MQEAVEIELGLQDPNYEERGKLESRVIFYYLSRYEMDYIKLIYEEGFDKNESNKRKLGKLLEEVTITGGDIVSSTFYPDAYVVTIPTDVLYTINERVDLTENAIPYLNILTKPISYDEYSANKNNPFRHANVEKCLRLEGVNSHTLLVTSDTDSLNNVYLNYIKTPLGINLSQDCELHEGVHHNIVSGAVKLIQAAMQNQVGYNIQSKEEQVNK